MSVERLARDRIAGETQKHADVEADELQHREGDEDDDSKLYSTSPCPSSARALPGFAP